MSITHKLIHNDYACREIGLIKCALDCSDGCMRGTCSTKEAVAVAAVGRLEIWSGAQSAGGDKTRGKKD